MAYKKYSKIRIRPIVYEKDTNGDYVLNTNNERTVSVQPQNVNPNNDYDFLVEIEVYE